MTERKLLSDLINYKWMMKHGIIMKTTSNIKLAITTGLLVLSGLSGINKVSAQTVWLDELDLSTATQGWDIPLKVLLYKFSPAR